jgi:hypothetical protein
MPKTIYESTIIQTIDGIELYIIPLKLKYLKELMDRFELIKYSKTENESIDCLIDCVRITMKQFHPEFKTFEDITDNFDIKTIYVILDFSAGIKFDNQQSDTEESEPVVSKQSESNTWETMNLAKLESEAFLLGIWKDYEDLESSISLPELTAILEAKREEDYNNKKFLAAIQGVDLDAQSGKKNEWEELKAKVFSRGKGNANDITSLQGQNAASAGFGIGMGLDYEIL